MFIDIMAIVSFHKDFDSVFFSW